MKKTVFTAAVVIILLLTEGCTNAGITEKKAVTETGLVYTCLPCGYGCDTLTYKTPGTCSYCKMELVDKASVKFGTVLPENICNFITGKGADSVVLLDVRTPEEFKGTVPDKFGRLLHAVNIPVQELQQRIHELDAFKNKEIIVYCSHSHRSPMASYWLNQNGFARVSNMALGMSEWRNRVTGNNCSSKYYIKQ